jgi:hypothetical protein
VKFPPAPSFDKLYFPFDQAGFFETALLPLYAAAAGWQAARGLALQGGVAEVGADATSTAPDLHQRSVRKWLVAAQCVPQR